MASKRAVALSIALLSACASQASSPNPIFDANIKATLARASVAVYLPAWLPPFDGPQKTLYAGVTLYPQGYLVSVDPVKDCNGANACSFIAVTGRSGTANGGGETATLSDGTKARFYPITCGASCSAASLEWAKNGAVYGIEMKDGDEATLLRIANSYVLER